MLSWTIITMASNLSMSLCSLALMPFCRNMSCAQQTSAAGANALRHLLR
jgi:hypothetical protein